MDEIERLAADIAADGRDVIIHARAGGVTPGDFLRLKAILARLAPDIRCEYRIAPP